MPLPATGDTYANILEPGLNQLNARKAIITDLLIRDYLDPSGIPRRLDLASAGLDADGVFSPWALDEKLRNDLLITSLVVPNLGFYHIGLMDEDGIAFATDANVEPLRAAQTKRAIRFDVTEEDDEITIKALEGNPIVDALAYDKPLANLQDLGQKGYKMVKDAETQLITRQVIALMFDGEHRSSKTFPRMQLKNHGDTNWNKANADVMEITLGALLDPYTKTPVIGHRAGSAWLGLQGVPLFAAAPVGAPGATGLATVTFAEPTSKSSSYQYTVTATPTDAGLTIDSVDDSGAPAAIVINLSGLTAGAKTFTVHAEGTSGLIGDSAASNSVTVV